MSKFRKKPIVIDAVQFSASNPETHLNVNFSTPAPDNEPQRVGKYWISTLEGDLFVSEGDWTITGVQGEHYPCKPDIFEATYEAMVDGE